MIKICIIDDDPLWLDHFKAVFDGERDFSVTGLFLTAQEAYKKIPKLSPDILLIDLIMPGINGIEVIKTVKAMFPAITLIALTSMDDPDWVESAIRAGARGYLLKTEPSSRMLDLLRETIKGGAAISSNSASQLISRMYGGQDTPALTKREKDILRQIDGGCSYKETAARFGVSVSTIHNQARKLFAKLNVRKKSEAVREARRLGMM
jgi:DNA-binding NarL/FixJ family response regulator